MRMATQVFFSDTFHFFIDFDCLLRKQAIHYSDMSGFQPSLILGSLPFLGRCPRLILTGPSALKNETRRDLNPKHQKSAEGAAPYQPGETPQEGPKRKRKKG